MKAGNPRGGGVKSSSEIEPSVGRSSAVSGLRIDLSIPSSFPFPEETAPFIFA